MLQALKAYIVMVGLQGVKAHREALLADVGHDKAINAT